MRVLAPLAVLFSGALAVSCSSSEPGARDEPFPDPDLPAVTVNPDGAPYPTDHLGGNERRGGVRGDRIPNFTFKGYRSGRGGGLEDISLAEFYDPEQKRHKILHLQVAATWCAICSSVLSATLTVVEPLAERGVVFFEVIVSGTTPGAGPSLAEVDAWVDRHASTLPTGIDVAARRLGALGVNGAVMPHDIVIDTRTMEILDSSTGAPVDVGQYVLSALRFVEANPPSY